MTRSLGALALALLTASGGEGRAANERVMRSFIAALNRHDVDAQYAHFAPDMAYVDEGRRIVPNKEDERRDREFEAANGAVWSHLVLDGDEDSLELLITEDMEFYRLLGVGPRSHRARYTFRDGRIREGRAWDWTQAGRPYDGARDSFVAWLVAEHPAAAARLAPNSMLLFTKDSAPLINPLVRQWRAARPCRLYHPSFSPNGERIVFSSDCEGPWGIYVMNADGTMPRRLTERGREARQPRWSPDGATIVFQSNRGGNWDVYSIATDGTGLRRLTDDPAADTSPAFSPVGARLLFASDRTGSNELFVMPATGGAATQITRNRSVGFRSVWSPDGSHVLFRASTPPSKEPSEPGQFFRMRPDGGDAGVVGGGPRREYNQAYSPDGSRIAFDAHRDGAWESADGRWEIWVMNADGSGRRRLTSDSVNDWGPSWSPDGRSILFLSGSDNVYDIFVMGSDGSNRRRLTHWTERAEGADAQARRILDAALSAVGGAERLSARPHWYVEGKGRENLSAEQQGLRPDEPTWRPHEEKVAVDARALAVAWERRTPRNDQSLRWRRMIFKTASYGVVDWNAGFGAIRERANPEPYRRALRRRVPHLLVLEAARDARRWAWRGERSLGGRPHDEIEVELDEAAPLLLLVSREPALLARAEYLAHLPGRGDVVVGWEWHGWKPDAELGWVPAGHRVDVAGDPFQQVDYSRFSTSSDAAAELLEVPARFLAPAAGMPMGHSTTPATPPLPASGMVAPGVMVASIGGFRVMFVELGDFVAAFEAPEAHPGFEAIAAPTSPSRLTAEYLALIEKTFPGKPLRYAVISHHHSDHMGGLRVFAAAGATLLVARGHRASAERLLAAPHTLAADVWSRAPGRAKLEVVEDRRTLGDGVRRLEVWNVGENPHTAENLLVWLPSERILMQGDLFYYDEGAPFPPSGRATMNRFFARWLRERGIEPRAVYGVHNAGAAGPEWLAAALKLPVASLQPADVEPGR